ncbi:hypothetical protein UXP37_12420, partial [Enterobacter bugandensis]|uniref:hypothetical protein n=1 Tax=Enterobacter bugandensis TaxID=881260 RepID=UPI002FD4A5BF
RCGVFCFVRRKYQVAAPPYPAYKTCRPGKRSATGHGRPHDPTVKRSKNTKEGIYKRRKAKTQP